MKPASRNLAILMTRTLRTLFALMKCNAIMRDMISGTDEWKEPVGPDIDVMVRAGVFLFETFGFIPRELTVGRQILDNEIVLLYGVDWSDHVDDVDTDDKDVIQFFSMLLKSDGAVELHSSGYHDSILTEMNHEEVAEFIRKTLKVEA